MAWDASELPVMQPDRTQLRFLLPLETLFLQEPPPRGYMCKLRQAVYQNRATLLRWWLHGPSSAQCRCK